MRTPLFAALLAIATAAPAHAGSLFDMSIIDRDTGKELPTYLHDGKTYVAGTPGHRYMVQLVNKTAGRVLAVMSVDGVNVLTGETADPNQRGYIWYSRESNTIKGWRKNLDEVAQFVFTALPDSYAARTGRPENVGVIGVAAFTEKPEPPMMEESPRQNVWPPITPATAAPPPPSAPLPAPSTPPSAPDISTLPGAHRAQEESSIAQDTSRLGTGHGSREYSRMVEVPFVRATREPQETLTIWYDSYEHLAAQGIIPEPIARREPQPFPKNRFVPDPPSR